MTENNKNCSKKTTILVVDDDPILCEMLSILLTSSGYSVVAAYDGVEAMTMLNKHPVRAILLDVMMPKMDGYEVCRRVKANPATAHIQVMLVTAFSDQKHRQQGLDSGADEFICKPVDAVHLLSIVRQMVPIRQSVPTLS
jgi:two-component system cell cycle response regulator